MSRDSEATDADQLAQVLTRYQEAQRAMRAGVTLRLDSEPVHVNPKSLRIDVNSAMVEHAALVGMLLDGGVFTKLQYFTALAEAMERERDSYRLWANRRFDTTTNVTLA